MHSLLIDYIDLNKSIFFAWDTINELSVESEIIIVNNKKIALKMYSLSTNFSRFIKHSHLADAFGVVAMFIDDKYWRFIWLQKIKLATSTKKNFTTRYVLASRILHVIFDIIVVMIVMDKTKVEVADISIDAGTTLKDLTSLHFFIDIPNFLHESSVNMSMTFYTGFFVTRSIFSYLG